LSIAAARPELPTTDFAQMIREIQELRHAEGEAAFEDETGELVTISTLHKAKGLEWDVVILADADKYKTRREQNLSMIATRGLIAYKGGSANIWHAFVSKIYKERDEQEVDRVMYVAATRAKKVLALGLPPKASTGFWAIIPSSYRNRLTRVQPLTSSAVDGDEPGKESDE
jgi:ATP-dependent helicase/nuclease subunit A